MRDKPHPNAPPPGAAWIWETREMLESDAWRSLTPAALRLLQFLKIEFMRHAGTANGRLKAPRRQLERFGIGAHQITAAIALLEQTGIVDCTRAGRRVASTFTLTWLPLPDGTTASDRWRGFREPETVRRHKSSRTGRFSLKKAVARIIFPIGKI